MRNAVTKLIPLALATAGLAGALTACSTPHAPAPAALAGFPSAPQPDNPVVYRDGNTELLADGSLVLPLDGYDAYAQPTDRTLLTDALTTVESTCMQAHGAHLPAGYATMDMPKPLPPLTYYGVTTTAQARTTAYRLPGTDDTRNTTQALATTADQNAFYGNSGCAQAAHASLQLSRADNAFNTVQDLRSQALLSLIADPALKTANAAWSSCMKTAGYDYATPTGPGHDKSLLGKGLPTPPGSSLPPVSPDERTAAQTDVTCKQKTNYLQTYATLAAEHQNRLIEQNTQKLQQALHDWQTVLTTARTHAGAPHGSPTPTP
ncbi:hypothetical protein [Kitasatospora viridis]|nr:hypothetical protein [Kitasatospora viridis]